ncbi:hypothetical protein ACQP00_46530 [Dactylosporangium sp. CS-047395]
MKVLVKLLDRAARHGRDRGAATLDIGLGAVLLGITLVAVITLFGESL